MANRVRRSKANRKRTVVVMVDYRILILTMVISMALGLVLGAKLF